MPSATTANVLSHIEIQLRCAHGRCHAEQLCIRPASSLLARSQEFLQCFSAICTTGHVEMELCKAGREKK